MLLQSPSVFESPFVPAQTFSFIDGWRTLPEELQFHILLLVVAPEPSRHGTLQMSYHEISAARYWNQHPFQGLALPLLTCPEIKPLVTEAFYTQNTFLLDYSFYYSEHIHLPPQQTYKLIRRLQLRLGVMSKQKFELLEKAADGTSNLDNLTFLDIHFRTPESNTVSPTYKKDAQSFRDYLQSIGSVWFESKYLRITYAHNAGISRIEPWQANLLDKLTLHPLAGGVETTCTQWTLRPCNHLNKLALQEMDALIRAGLLEHAGRWTVKEVVMQDENLRLEPYTRHDDILGLV